MSVQAGIYYFDGRPIGRPLVERLHALVQPYATDGVTSHVESGVAMLHGAVHVTSEDANDGQPIRSDTGVALTFDGRLDNRAELLADVGASPSASLSDAALALQLYERVTDDAFARLVGDWSLAIWHSRTRTLRLASDYMGVRPLFYCADATRVLWSTVLDVLVALAGRDELDERFLVGYLTHSPAVDATPYRDIRSVTPAHVVSFRPGGRTQTQRFWDLPCPPPPTGTVDDHASELRRLLTEAVDVRLRSRAPVWAELSGGLDSSAIVCLADSAGNKGARLASTISYYSPSSPESDERRFIRAVEAHTSHETTYVSLDHAFVDSLDRIGTMWPGAWLGATWETLNRAREARVRTILSGQLGDTVMGNTAEDTASLVRLLRPSKWRQLVAEARDWSRVSHRPALSLIADAARTWLPTGWQAHHAYDRFLARQTGPRLDRAADPARLFSINRDLVDIIRENRACSSRAAARYPAPSRRLLAEGIYRTSLHRSLQSTTAGWRTAYTYPFAHRPLVEFTAALPPDVLVRPGQPRLLMRRALGDILPAIVLNRRSKTFGQTYKLRVLTPYAAGLLDRLPALQVVERGLVDPQSLRRRLEEVVGGGCMRVGNLMHLVVLERWLQARTSAGAPADAAHNERR